MFLIDIMKRLVFVENLRNIKLDIIGKITDSYTSSNLERIIKKNKLQRNIRFFPEKKYEEMLEYVSNADLGSQYLHQKGTKSHHLLK